MADIFWANTCICLQKSTLSELFFGSSSSRRNAQGKQMIQFSAKGTSVWTGKVKPEPKFNFVNDKNVEQIKADLKKMEIEPE